jgi:hypothetical protein
MTYSEGNHDRFFWNDHTLDAFGYLARQLSG